MATHDGGDFLQQRRQTHVLQGQALVIEDQIADVARQARLVHLAVAHPVEQHLDHIALVAPREAGEHVDDLPAPLCAQAPDHAEVDDRQTVARQIEHVSGMRVSVKIAVLESSSAPHRRRDAPARADPARPARARQIGAGDPLDALLDVDAVMRVFPVHTRDDDVGSPAKFSAKRCCARSSDRSSSRWIERLNSATTRTGWKRRTSASPLHQRGEAAEDAQVASIFGRIRGRMTLSTTGVPSCRGRMYLGDGGGAQRG